MLKLFEVCFYTGAFFTVVSFVMSQFGHIHGIGGHSEIGDLSGHGIELQGHGGGIDAGGLDAGGLDTGGHGFEGGHGADISAHGGEGTESGAGGSEANVAISPFKPTVISAFVTTFGGIGIILSRQGLLPILVLLGALAAGFIAGFILYQFVVVPLYRAQNTSSVSERYLKGAIGKMDLTAEGKTYGKVSYIVNGNTMTSPALSWNGELIPRGKTVVVVDIKKNTFYVKEIRGVD